MMKKVSKYVAIMSVIIVAVLFAGCSKEGPAGPAGKNGIDGNAKCGVCHNSTTLIFSKELQWSHSGHGTLPDFERNTNQCAPCHTSEGFREICATKADSTVTTVNNPSPQNCRTCHFIHTAYDSTDWKLTWSDPVKLYYGDATVDFGRGNLCARCHQARPVSPAPPVPGGPDYTISNTRYGPHHGPMANMIAGVGLIQISGSEIYANSPHKNVVKDVCITCHMQTAYGAQSGGHTWNMTYDLHGVETDNTASCNTAGCHLGATSFDKISNNLMGDCETLLTNLRGALAAKGILDTTASGGVYELDVLKKGTFNSTLAAAAFNYMTLAADRSNGAHNMKYIHAALKNSYDAVK